MTIDTYGLSEEQYTEFFEDNMRLACKLYLQACNIATAENIGNVDFKTLRELYSESLYATNDDCRQYQKEHDPEIVSRQQEDLFIYNSPSREEMMEGIRSLNAKVEVLSDYISNLTNAIEKIS
jgi:hypothetical protein